MKLIQLILVLLSIVSNEIVAEIVYSDEHKITLLDTTSQEAENENSELEGELEIEFANEFGRSFFLFEQDFQSSIDRELTYITNPYLEINSPPPEV